MSQDRLAGAGGRGLVRIGIRRYGAGRRPGKDMLARGVDPGRFQ